MRWTKAGGEGRPRLAPFGLGHEQARALAPSFAHGLASASAASLDVAVLDTRQAHLHLK